MVYKKYITCDGKTYGPYFYESYREDGKVKKRYIKMPDDNFFSGVTKNFLSILLIFSLVFVLMFFSFSNFTRDFVLDVKEVYSTGEMLEGGLIIGLNSGEFLPVDSIVSVNFNDSNYEFILRDIVSEESRVNSYEKGFFLSNFPLLSNGKSILSLFTTASLLYADEDIPIPTEVVSPVDAIDDA